MPVISISRRTDIPAFYGEWLLNRLRAGFCHVANPFNGTVRRVSLRAEECLALVFWTRHPAAVLSQLDFLQASGYARYTQVTINGYPRLLEPHAPPVEEAVAGFRRLAEASAPEYVVWRYDPIVLGEDFSPDDHLRRFAGLAAVLNGATRRCVTSFVDCYGKTRRNLARAPAVPLREPSLEERRRLLHAMAEIAAAHGIVLSVCCENELVDARVARARCVDPEILRLLRPDWRGPLRAAPSRPQCGCVESVDIGAYDTCLYGCRYCYATNDLARARQRRAAHDPEDTILSRPPALQGVDLSLRAGG